MQDQHLRNKKLTQKKKCQKFKKKNDPTKYVCHNSILSATCKNMLLVTNHTYVHKQHLMIYSVNMFVVKRQTCIYIG